MGKINVLDKHVAELIAAGEVVERPASVIKELVENSIDAGAAIVTVEIKAGGVSYMRITDNGCGMAREDVPVAFLRHATSKVHKQDDLEQIGTLGFRGEALASVASVSHVEVLTCEPGAVEGTHYIISGGEEEYCGPAGCAAGTTMMIRDLFYNTPARMKFLKKDVTEANAVAAVMDKLALSHPEVSIRFIREGKEALHTPGDGSLKSAIYTVFGKEFTAGLIPVDYSYQGIRAHGFVSKPAAARPNRSMQHFFINGRYIKSRTAMVALEEAFKGTLMVGKLPACVLHLDIAAGAVDVNVHPAKLEVRFVNEKPIFDCVYYGVKTALQKGDTPNVMHFPQSGVPSITPVRQEVKTFKEPSPAEPAHEEKAGDAELSKPGPLPESAVERRFESHLPNKRTLEDPAAKSTTEQAGPSAGTAAISSPIPVHYEPARPLAVRPDIYYDEDEPGSDSEHSKVISEKKDINAYKEEKIHKEEIKSFFPEPTNQELTLVGEAFGTYIILQSGKEELVIIDKHAAHERMLYEQLKQQETEAYQQMLLAPVPVTLDKNEYAAVLESLELYAKAGFEIEDFGAGTVLVRSAPLVLGGEGVADAVMEIAGYLLNAKNDLTTEKLDWLYHNVACRAAVKAGDVRSTMELMDLAKRLQQHPEIRYCPHGRPVCIIMKRKDLEQQFGRI